MDHGSGKSTGRIGWGLPEQYSNYHRQRLHTFTSAWPLARNWQYFLGAREWPWWGCRWLYKRHMALEDRFPRPGAVHAYFLAHNLVPAGHNSVEKLALITRVDFLGSFTLVSALALLLLGLTTGGNIVPWTHPLASVSLPLAAAFFCIFVFVEQKLAREPILPLHFLRDRTVLCACLTNWFFHLTTYVFIFYIPIYYRARGASTTQAGAALIPFSITFPIGSLVAGIITTKTGKYKRLLRAILLLMVLGTIQSCTNRLSTPLWPAMIEFAVVGLATGAMLTVTLLALISAVDPSEQAVVTSLSYVFRSTGSVVGLALASAVYQAVLENDLWRKIGDQENAADVIRSIKDSLDEIDRLPGQIQWAVRSSYMVALRATFMTSAAFAVMALVSGLLIRELKLHSTLTREEEEDALPEGEPFGK